MAEISNIRSCALEIFVSHAPIIRHLWRLLAGVFTLRLQVGPRRQRRISQVNQRTNNRHVIMFRMTSDTTRANTRRRTRPPNPAFNSTRTPLQQHSRNGPSRAIISRRTSNQRILRRVLLSRFARDNTSTLFVTKTLNFRRVARDQFITMDLMRRKTHFTKVTTIRRIGVNGNDQNFERVNVSPQNTIRAATLF